MQFTFHVDDDFKEELSDRRTPLYQDYEKGIKDVVSVHNRPTHGYVGYTDCLIT